MRRRLLRLIGASLVAGLLMLQGIGSAAAHAVLESATPADRSIQPIAPTSFHLQFDEPVGVTDLRLLDAAGHAQPIAIEAKDAVISGEIQTSLAPGTYIIAYRVISADSHPVAGAVQFQVGGGTAHWQAMATGLAWWQWGKIACLLLLYLGAFVFWAACYRARRRPDGADRLGLLSCIPGILGAALLPGFQGAGMTGEGGGQFFLTPATWAVGMGTAEGRLALLFIAAMALGWLALYLRSRPYPAAALIWASAAIMIGALATTGHVAVLGWPQQTVLAIHVAGALLWAGSLVPLLRRLTHRAASQTAARWRWRRSSMAVILAAIASGIGLACWQVVTPSGLLSTAYGLVLSAKVMAVIALVGSLTINWRLARHDPVTPHDQRWLRPWLAGQVGLMVIILGLTAALGQLIPPRHLLAAGTGQVNADQPVAAAMVHAGDVMAMLTLRPEPGGRYALAVSFATMKGEMLTPGQVGLAISNLDARIGPLSRRMSGGDHAAGFVVGALDLVPAGRWRLEVTADISDFDRRSFVMEAIIPPGRP